MSGLFKLFSITLTAALLSACGGQPDDADVVPAQGENSPAVIAQVDTDRIKAAADEPEMWLTYGGTYDEQRHSALGQINRDTLPDWEWGGFTRRPNREGLRRRLWLSTASCMFPAPGQWSTR